MMLLRTITYCYALLHVVAYVTVNEFLLSFQLKKQKVELVSLPPYFLLLLCYYPIARKK